MDDQPIFMRTRTRRILALPYPQEINDIPMIIGRKIEGAAFAQLIVDHFDEMVAQSAGEALVMGVALHPYIVGQPHRLRHLRRALTHVGAYRDRVWLTRAGDIATFVRTLPAGVVPGG
jgi:allantoinase